MSICVSLPQHTIQCKRQVYAKEDWLAHHRFSHQSCARKMAEVVARLLLWGGGFIWLHFVLGGNSCKIWLGDGVSRYCTWAVGHVESPPQSNWWSARTSPCKWWWPGSWKAGDRLRLATEQAKLAATCSDGTLDLNAYKLSPLCKYHLLTTPPFATCTDKPDIDCTTLPASTWHFCATSVLAW